jgi:hypothetical protein
MNDDVILLEVEEACPRCGKKNIGDDGVCPHCRFKAWYAYH